MDIVIGILLSGLFWIGYKLRDIEDSVKQRTEPKTAPSVTYGSEKPANENYPINNPHSNIVLPKTPQQVEAEAKEATRQQALNATEQEVKQY